MSAYSLEQRDIAAAERPRSLFGTVRIGYSDRIKFYERLAGRLDKQTNLVTAVYKSASKQSDDGPPRTAYARLLHFWYQALAGRVPGLASIKFGDLVHGHIPPMERIFILAGEQSADEQSPDEVRRSRLSRALRAARHYAAVSHRLMATTRTAWVMPFVFFIIDMLMISVAGAFRQAMEAGFNLSNLRYSGLVGLYVGFTDFFFRFGPALVGGLILIALVLMVALPRWTGRVRRWCDRHVPVFRTYMIYQGANVLAALAQMIGIDRSPAQAVGAILGYEERAPEVWTDRPDPTLSSATPWLRMWLEPLFHRLCHNHPDLADALWFEGGEFPSKEIVRDLRDDASASDDTNLSVTRLEQASAELAGTIEETVRTLAWASLVFSVSVSALVFIGDWFVTSAITEAAGMRGF